MALVVHHDGWCSSPQSSADQFPGMPLLPVSARPQEHYRLGDGTSQEPREARVEIIDEPAVEGKDQGLRDCTEEGRYEYEKEEVPAYRREQAAMLGERFWVVEIAEAADERKDQGRRCIANVRPDQDFPAARRREVAASLPKRAEEFVKVRAAGPAPVTVEGGGGGVENAVAGSAGSDQETGGGGSSESLAVPTAELPAGRTAEGLCGATAGDAKVPYRADEHAPATAGGDAVDEASQPATPEIFDGATETEEFGSTTADGDGDDAFAATAMTHSKDVDGGHRDGSGAKDGGARVSTESARLKRVFSGGVWRVPGTSVGE